MKLNKIINRTFCSINKNGELNVLINDLYKFILKDKDQQIEIKENNNSYRGLFYKSSTPLPIINTQTNKPNILYKEEPFISYPSIITTTTTTAAVDNNKEICNHCLKLLNHNNNKNNDNICKCEECSIKYCSLECKEKSSIQYHSVLCKSTGSGFNYLEKHASIEKRRFPLLAGKIMARMIMGYHLEKSSKNTWLPLQLLSYAKKPPPLEWKDDYLIFSRSLLKSLSPGMSKRFDYDSWFVRVMQILYLNTIGIDIDYRNEINSTKMSSPESGIGLYFATSFINHSCDPNTYVHFPDDHTLHLKLLKPLSPGDEITISYTDTTKDIVDRRSHLFENYGFNCNCPKCLNDLKIKKQQ